MLFRCMIYNIFVMLTGALKVTVNKSYLETFMGNIKKLSKNLITLSFFHKIVSKNSS